MTITLDAQLEAAVREKVDAGLYGDAAEVIREALRLLDEHDRERLLRAKLARAEEQADRGELIEFTPELLDKLGREADEMFRQGKQPHPDVCP